MSELYYGTNHQREETVEIDHSSVKSDWIPLCVELDTASDGREAWGMYERQC